MLCNISLVHEENFDGVNIHTKQHYFFFTWQLEGLRLPFYQEFII